MYPEFENLSRKTLFLLSLMSLLCVGAYTVLSALRLLPGDAWWELIIIGLYALVLSDLIGVAALKVAWLSKPEPNCVHWIKFTLVTGGIIASVVWCTGLLARFAGWDLIPAYGRHFGWPEFMYWLWYACFRAPIIEESLFRWILCPVFTSIWGLWPTVLLSGSLFGLVHFVYGNPSPDNFFAGYFLAWAFIRSKSIWVPVFMHAAGNLCVGLFFLFGKGLI